MVDCLTCHFCLTTAASAYPTYIGSAAIGACTSRFSISAISKMLSWTVYI
jgi:hypothetical protein